MQNICKLKWWVVVAEVLIQELLEMEQLLEMEEQLLLEHHFCLVLEEMAGE